MPPLVLDNFPSTPGKVKIERSNYFGRMSYRWQSLVANPFLWLFGLVSLAVMLVLVSKSLDGYKAVHGTSTWGGLQWEKKVRHSSHPKRSDGKVVLVTGAAGFVGMHVSLALKKRGDGVLGLDNFNSYYDPSLKRARRDVVENHGIFIVEGDINDAALLKRLFETVSFTHVMHLAAQAGVRYAMENPSSLSTAILQGW